ncbi:hypothetical protein ABZ490_43975 [Streptomyces sp. NPDC005811]|uniref:hypothetical protein n=1 Tax=Streptomyces sp. NPDC005811 TaxID=3154565 RepID=UPI0033CC33FD
MMAHFLRFEGSKGHDGSPTCSCRSQLLARSTARSVLGAELLAARIGGRDTLRTQCTASGGLVRTLIGDLAQRGEPLPGATEAAELVGGQLQGLQVGAQRGDIGRAGLLVYGLLVLAD